MCTTVENNSGSQQLSVFEIFPGSFSGASTASGRYLRTPREFRRGVSTERPCDNDFWWRSYRRPRPKFRATGHCARASGQMQWWTPEIWNTQRCLDGNWQQPLSFRFPCSPSRPARFPSCASIPSRLKSGEKQLLPGASPGATLLSPRPRPDVLAQLKKACEPWRTCSQHSDDWCTMTITCQLYYQSCGSCCGLLTRHFHTAVISRHEHHGHGMIGRSPSLFISGFVVRLSWRHISSGRQSLRSLSLACYKCPELSESELSGSSIRAHRRALRTGDLPQQPYRTSRISGYSLFETRNPRDKNLHRVYVRLLKSWTLSLPKEVPVDPDYSSRPRRCT